MAHLALAELTTEAVASIEDVGSRIENVFAEVGSDLGQSHAMFEQLNSGLSALAQELSESTIGPASAALMDIAARLQDLADALPAETALLGHIGENAAQASVLLKEIAKHIHMITIIARSSKIEAASLADDRGGFLSFTQETADLASSVQQTIVTCSKNQEKLTEAVAVALTRQREFVARYHAQLVTASKELTAACDEIRDRQTQSTTLAELARTSTVRIGGAVGTAIVSLQAGDATRQRLEHICRGLRGLSAETSLVPAEACDAVAVDPLICGLQVMQLKDTIAEFGAEMTTIGQSLRALTTDSSKVVAHGVALYGDRDDDMTSFLAVMKQRISKASALIAACSSVKVAVDQSMAVVDGMLGDFRTAISSLGDTVIDITLIGMNAGLKAAHIGVKGRAFVVIANELKTTADRISAGAKLLEPVVDKIGTAAEQLRGVRIEEQNLNVAETERSIVEALRQIESGNSRLGEMMAHLTRESTQFQLLVDDATRKMSDLGKNFSGLTSTVARLDAPIPTAHAFSSSDARLANAAFDELYSKYTMAREREVHLRYCSRFSFLSAPTVQLSATSPENVEDVLFF